MTQEPLTKEEYENERNHLRDLEQRLYDGYERALLTLASAFLAFSVALIRIVGVGPNGTGGVEAADFLTASWILFAFSVLAVVAAFRVAARAARYDNDFYGDWYQNEQEPERMPSAAWNRMSNLLHLSAGWAFAAGVACMIFFAHANLANISGGTSGSEKTNVGAEGAPPPNVPEAKEKAAEACRADHLESAHQVGG